MLALIGTYTRDTDSEGIYGFNYDKKSGALTAVSVNPGIDNPSYITKHPLLDVVYVVNEVGDFNDEKSGAVSAFSLNSGGKLSLISQLPPQR